MTGATSLKDDNAHAKRALKDATSVSLTLHVADPDGALKKSILKDNSGPRTAQQVDALTAGSVSFVVTATGGRKLGDKLDLGLSAAEQLKRSNVEMTVNGLAGRLVDIRVVDGVLYVGSDIEAVKRAAALAATDGPEQVDQFFTEAPDEVKAGTDDLRAGKYLKLALPGYLDTLKKKVAELNLPGGSPSLETKDYARLIRELRHAITPHITLRDLGESGDTRNVSVDIAVKRALIDALAVLRSHASTLGFPPDMLPASTDLEQISDSPLSASLRISHGHYTRLAIPFASFEALDASPSKDAPQLGKSGIVLDIDDSAPPVTTPTHVSSFDVSKLVNQAFDGLSGVSEGYPNA